MTAYLNALGVVCSLGRGPAEVASKLFAGDCSGMLRASGWVPERDLDLSASEAFSALQPTAALPATPGLPAAQPRSSTLRVPCCARPRSTASGARPASSPSSPSSSGVNPGNPCE